MLCIKYIIQTMVSQKRGELSEIKSNREKWITEK